MVPYLRTTKRSVNQFSGSGSLNFAPSGKEARHRRIGMKITVEGITGEGKTTVEGLLANEEYAKAISWVRTQDPFKHPKIHNSNRKKGRRR